MAKLNEKQVEEAGRMRLAGRSWREIGRAFGVKEETVQRAVDPFHAERMKRRMREWRARNGVNGRQTISGPHQPRLADNDDVRARRAEIPDDRRDLTAYLCGDPLPGRSALDQRRSA